MGAAAGSSAPTFSSAQALLTTFEFERLLSEGASSLSLHLKGTTHQPVHPN